MADDTPGISPAEDPYEFDWPDDAREQRDAEREAAPGAVANRPKAPLWLAALSLGILTMLVYLVAVGAAARVPIVVVQLTLPVVLVATFAALPIGLILERFTRRARAGLAEVAFLVVGGALGYFWTFWVWQGFLADYVFDNYATDFISDDPSAEIAGFRDASSLFMMTATATAFLVARMLTEGVARFRIGVYIAAGFIGALTVWSAVGWALDLS